MFQVGEPGLQVQDLFQAHHRAAEAMFLQDRDHLPGALGVGAGRFADVEVVADHHDVAGFHRAGCLDALDLARIEALHGFLDDLGLAAPRFGAGAGDDGAARGAEHRVLDEHRVGEAFVRRQQSDVHVAGLQGADVGVVLLQGLGVVRLAEVAGGQAVDQAAGGRASDDVLEHDDFPRVGTTRSLQATRQPTPGNCLGNP